MPFHSFRFVVLVMLGLLFPSFASVGFASGSGLFGERPPVEDGLQSDALEYAVDNGVDLEEAKYRLSLQETIGKLEQSLASEEEFTFGGLYIEHQPTFRVVALFTNSHAERRMAKRLAKSPLKDLVEIRQVKYSLEQLKADQAAAIYAASSIGVTADAGINLAENRAELYVLNGERSRNRLADGGFALPSSVAMLEVDDLAASEVNLYGGLSLPTCTTGFSVRNFWRTEFGVLTAGHCGNNQSYNGTALTFEEESFETAYDVQWHSSDNFTFRNWIKGSTCSNCVRSITGTRGRVWQSVGNFVCKQGRTTGYTCGYISDKSYKPHTPASASATFIRVHRDGVNLSSGGDSGGPWFNGNTAYGIHTDGIGDDSAYMAINYISVLDMYVLTD